MRHDESDPQHRPELVAWNRGLEGHPRSEDLAAYHDGRLPPERDAALREHIVECEVCLEVILELRRDLTTPTEEMTPEPDEISVQAAWRLQRARMQKAGLLNFQAQPRPQHAWLLAAALVIVSVGLALWVATLKQTVHELTQPLANPPLASLAPVGAVREPANLPSISIPDRRSRVWLILTLNEDVDYPNYRVRFVLPDGQVLWSLEGLQRTPTGSFRIELPSRSLPRSEVRVLLSGSRGLKHILVAEYRVRFTDS